VWKFRKTPFLSGWGGSDFPEEGKNRIERKKGEKKGTPFSSTGKKRNVEESYRQAGGGRVISGKGGKKGGGSTIPQREKGCRSRGSYSRNEKGEGNRGRREILAGEGKNDSTISGKKEVEHSREGIYSFVFAREKRLDLGKRRSLLFHHIRKKGPLHIGKDYRRGRKV